MGFFNSIFGATSAPPIKKYSIKNANNRYVNTFIVADIKTIPVKGKNVQEGFFGKCFKGNDITDEIYKFTQRSKFITPYMFMHLVDTNRRRNSLVCYFEENSEGYLLLDDKIIRRVLGWQQYDKITQSSTIQLFKGADDSVTYYLQSNFE